MQVAYEVDGRTMRGYLARPDAGDGPWPAVLIGHDGVGLEHYQRGRADDLAQRGYIVFAMDYYGGRTFFGQPDEMLAVVMPLLADPVRMRAVGQAALDVLLAEPGVDRDRLGAVGFGAGGSIVLQLAARVPFRGVGLVHPGLPAATEDWAGVTGSVLLCTGSDDPLCPPDRALAFGRSLQDAGVDWRVQIYGGAEHAFWSESTGDATVPGVGHHPTHAARAWRAVVDLLDESVQR